MAPCSLSHMIKDVYGRNLKWKCRLYIEGVNNVFTNKFGILWLPTTQICLRHHFIHLFLVVPFTFLSPQRLQLFWRKKRYVFAELTLNNSGLHHVLIRLSLKSECLSGDVSCGLGRFEPICSYFLSRWSTALLRERNRTVKEILAPRLRLNFSRFQTVTS